MIKQEAQDWQSKFDTWKESVDKYLILLCGLSSDDLDDWCYATDFDSGLSSKQSARRAIKNANF